MTPHQAWLYPHVVHPYRARRYVSSANRAVRSVAVLTVLAAIASAALVVAVAPVLAGW